MNGIPELIFKGIKDNMLLISAMRDTRLLRQGCQKFLAAVMGEQGVDSKRQSISVVKEYPEVFPKELPGLLWKEK